MANNFAAFFETLVAGADEYNKAKVGRTALLDAVYKDIKPEAARIGKTVDVYFPDVGPLQAINNGQLTATSVNPNYIPLVFQTRAGAALQFQDFEQWQTAVDLAQKFFDPLYKRAREYLNGQIAATITTANFNSNAPIIGATQGEVVVTDQLQAWDVLADQKVPLEDSAKLRLMVHNNVYRKMLGDSAWVQESLVSATIARAGPRAGRPGHAFNFQPIWDQQMPSSSGSIIYGQVSVTNGSTAVTGSNTAFTTDLTTSNTLTFGNDPTKTQYTISSITSDTALVLGSTYSGATAASTTARKLTVLVGTVSEQHDHADRDEHQVHHGAEGRRLGLRRRGRGQRRAHADRLDRLGHLGDGRHGPDHCLFQLDPDEEELHQPGPARVRHRPGPAADRHAGRGPQRRRRLLHRPHGHPPASHGQLRPHLPGPVRHGRLRLRPGRHPARLRRDHRVLRRFPMILRDAGAELAYTQGFSPVGLGNKWGLLPDGVTAAVTLTNAAAQSIDWSTGGLFLITLGVNTTFSYVNAQVGQSITLVLTQDGTGSRTGTFPTGSVFVGGSKTLTTTAAAIDTVMVICTAPGVYLCNLLKAYA